MGKEGFGGESGLGVGKEGNSEKERNGTIGKGNELGWGKGDA